MCTWKGLSDCRRFYEGRTEHAVLCNPDLSLLCSISGNSADGRPYLRCWADNFFPRYCKQAASGFCSWCRLCSYLWFRCIQCSDSGLCIRFYRTDPGNYCSDCFKESGTYYLRFRTCILWQCYHRCICQWKGWLKGCSGSSVYLRIMPGIRFCSDCRLGWNGSLRRIFRYVGLGGCMACIYSSYEVFKLYWRNSYFYRSSCYSADPVLQG